MTEREIGKEGGEHYGSQEKDNQKESREEGREEGRQEGREEEGREKDREEGREKDHQEAQIVLPFQVLLVNQGESRASGIFRCPDIRFQPRERENPTIRSRPERSGEMVTEASGKSPVIRSVRSADCSGLISKNTWRCFGR